MLEDPETSISAVSKDESVGESMMIDDEADDECETSVIPNTRPTPSIGGSVPNRLSNPLRPVLAPSSSATTTSTSPISSANPNNPTPGKSNPNDAAVLAADLPLIDPWIQNDDWKKYHGVWGSFVQCVAPRLFLGGRPSAMNWDLLRDCGITHVVNAADEIENYFPRHIKYFNCHLKDDLTEIIDFESAHNFIQTVIGEGGTVLVHCLAGASRSAAIVIAFLMRIYGMDLKSAFHRCQTCRPAVNPNPNYIRQLVALDVSLYGKSAFDVNAFYVKRLCSILCFMDPEVVAQIVKQANGDFGLALAKSIECASTMRV